MKIDFKKMVAEREKLKNSQQVAGHEATHISQNNHLISAFKAVPAAESKPGAKGNKDGVIANGGKTVTDLEHETGQRPENISGKHLEQIIKPGAGAPQKDPPDSLEHPESKIGPGTATSGGELKPKKKSRPRDANKSDSDQDNYCVKLSAETIRLIGIYRAYHSLSVNEILETAYKKFLASDKKALIDGTKETKGEVKAFTFRANSILLRDITVFARKNALKNHEILKIILDNFFVDFTVPR